MTFTAKRQQHIEHRQFDLARPINRDGEIFHLSGSHDRHWTGVVDLAPQADIVLGSHCRNDLLILDGELVEYDRATVYPTGSFISHNKQSHLRSGRKGTRVLWYRDTEPAHHCPPIAIAPQRQWKPGAAPGIFIAGITNFQHDLNFVRWVAGAQLHFHPHPRGEDIFVISGELRDQDGAYPAGSWMRFHPGSGHAPHVHVETVILLRSGHLYAM